MVGDSEGHLPDLHHQSLEPGYQVVLETDLAEAFPDNCFILPVTVLMMLAE